MKSYEARIVRIIDADTFECMIELPFDIYIKRSVRLFGIDAWEVFGPNRELGKIAKQFCIDHYLNKDVTLEVHDESEKYGRVLADIYTESGLISDVLRKHGHCKF